MIGPAHARQWETVAVAGRWDLWEEWKRRLVMMNEDEARRAGRAPFPLWDFSGYNWMTTEPFPEAGDRGRRMTWYWESSHFVKEAGDRVLDRVAGKRDAADDFGVLLSSPMLESHLNAIRRGREEWKLRYPVDVAEIEALGREGRELRERLRAIASRP